MNLIRQITVPVRCADCHVHTQWDHLPEYELGYFCKECWRNFAESYVNFLSQGHTINNRKTFEVFLKEKYGTKVERMYIDEDKFQDKLYKIVSDYLFARL